MKRFSYLTLFFAMAMVFAMRSQSFASSDTLKIYASDTQTLDAIINADQAATPHQVYELMSADTPYTFVNGIVINTSCTILGKTGAMNRPPCIQPDPSTSATTAHDRLFTFAGYQTTVDFENVYLLGIATDNTINEGDGVGIQVTADSVHLIVNNCVLEQWSQFGIAYQGNWDKLTITNDVFRNFCNPGSDYTGEAIRFRNDLGHFPSDSVVIKDCTFLGINGYVAAVGITSYARYIDFENNTVCGVYKNPFFNMNATNWVNQHNIYYAAYAGGMANGEYPWWDRIWAPGLGSVIDLDSMNQAISGYIVDTSAANWKTLAEAARVIEVNNNIYFMPDSVAGFVTAWDDTAHGLDSIYTCGWMNDTTLGLFASHSNFHETGNKVGTDPGFGTGIAEMLGTTTVPSEDGIGMLAWLTESRQNGDIATDFWGYHMQAPDYTSGNWEPEWPLAERHSGDLHPSASYVAYGDPNNITAVKQGVAPVADKFSLSNNYPNPFNPTTKIAYTVAKSGFATLKVYNVLGQEVTTLFAGNLTAGVNQFATFDGSRFASGIYFYTLRSAGNSITKKMVLVK